MGTLLLLLLFLGQDKKPVYDQPIRSIEESLYVSRIEREQERYRKIVESAEEIVKLCNSLTAEVDRPQLIKKIEKVEKLVKKIRSEQGGDDGEETVLTPNIDLRLRMQQLAKQILDETKLLNRHSISASLIDKTNEMIQIIKAIKSSENR
ncbi:MAG: hypothetical protein RMM17_03150 [Acidobacteriota bacterium]|nr:hypothetical protein [Blastocatellia bacterium]MDW8411666.1 hypothetical protein [Acidobacteriota bacterium]